MKIRGAEYAIKTLFSKDFVFKIPAYQRPYAWTDEHAGDLLEDLIDFLPQPGSNEAVSPYFLGSIVLIKQEDQAEAEVVDGQQRLTTLTILLAVIRDLVPEKNARELTEFLYDEANTIKNIPARYRLFQRKRDAEFFQQSILDPDGLKRLLEEKDRSYTESRSLMRQNALLFRERLSKLDEATRLALAAYISNNCYMVAVSTPDLDSAYRIFSVLNQRGLELGTSDILKAQIIGDVPEDERARYTDLWEEVEEELGRDLFQDLFGYIRTIYFKTKLKKTILAELKELIKKHHPEPRAFINEVIKPQAELLGEIMHAEFESTGDAREVNRLLRWLGRIDYSDWIPPTILFMQRHRFETDQIIRFLGSLERLAVSLWLRGASPNDRFQRHSELLASIDEGADLESAGSPLQLSKLEQIETLEALRGNLYRKTKLCRYVLLRLNEAYSEGVANYDVPYISIEHVLPQNPPEKSQWTDWFPDADERAWWTNRLANLVLLSRRKNSKASNYDFDKKKTAYFTPKSGSPFTITSEVLKHDSWKPSLLVQRQETIVELLRGAWELDSGLPTKISAGDEAFRLNADYEHPIWVAEEEARTIYLLNEDQWVGPDIWTGRRAYVVANAPETVADHLLTLDYFRSCEEILRVPMKIEVGDSVFLFDESEECWQTEDEGQSITLYNGGEASEVPEWAGEEVHIESSNPEPVIAKLTSLSLFQRVTNFESDDGSESDDDDDSE